MLTQLYLGARVIYNDHSGTPCPATVTRIYTLGSTTSNLDLHVVGVKGNASYARGKLNVAYGIGTIGAWEYPPERTVVVLDTDLPLDNEGLVYNATNDQFETEPVVSNLICIDGGLF